MNKRLLIPLLLTVLLAGVLRFYKVEQDPPGLYIDEASIGYNAYQILKTGKDEFGIAHPLFFKSFGDYKMPVYIYSVAGAMSVFGKNEFAVRLPSALAGTLTVFLFYFFVKKILELNRSRSSQVIKSYLPLLATFLLAISSWHIHFSRGGFEVNEGMLFYLVGVYLLLLFWEKKKRRFIIGGFFALALAMYTYHVFRILSPMTWVITSILFILKLPKDRKEIVIAGVMFLLFLFPILQFSFTPEGSSRFSASSAFSEYSTRSAQEKEFTFPMIYLKNYFSFFSLDFLFSNGDGNGRHQIHEFGLLFRFEFIFLILGIIWIFEQKKSFLAYITFFLLIVAPIPGAVARPSPHSLRGLILVLPLTMITSIGVITFLEFTRKKIKIALIILILIVLYELSSYIHAYYYHYSKVNALDWGAGYKGIVEKATEKSDQYDYLIVDKTLSFAPTYFLFYNDSLKPIFVTSDWIKPKSWDGKHILYIRPFYGKRSDPKLVNNIYLPGNNNDIFAQLWEL